MENKDLILSILNMILRPEVGSESCSSSIGSGLVGKFVICRSRNEGINAGTVVEMDSTGVVLSDCRRIWYHKPKDVNKSWYEGVAMSGISEDSKVSCTCDVKAIIEDYSLTLCTDSAKESIMSKVPNAQN